LPGAAVMVTISRTAIPLLDAPMLARDLLGTAGLSCRWGDGVKN